MSKTCSKCGEDKPLDNFSKNNRRKDGLDARCRDCRRIQDQIRKQKKKTAVAEKKCGNCGEVKPANKFSKDNKIRDGLNSQCKDCRRHIDGQRKHKKKVMVTEKKCSCCGLFKPRSEFASDSGNRTGLNSRCKSCSNKINQSWRVDNPEKNRLKGQRRREAEANAPGHRTAEQEKARFEYHGNRCVYCGSTEKLTVEHLIPIAKGGSAWPANIAPACQSCNSSKQHRHSFLEFREMKRGPN